MYRHVERRLIYLNPVGNGSPSVLTDPSIATISWGWVRLRSGWSLVSVVKEVGRHDTFESVLLGQKESNSQFVVVVVLVGEDSSGSTVTSLVVVVVDEYQGVETITETLKIKMQQYRMLKIQSQKELYW